MDGRFASQFHLGMALGGVAEPRLVLVVPTCLIDWPFERPCVAATLGGGGIGGRERLGQALSISVVSPRVCRWIGGRRNF